MTKQDRLLMETVAILSADIYEEIYIKDGTNGGNYQTTAQRVIELAEQFEKELNWQPDDTRDYIDELEKFENKILAELEESDE